MTKKYEKPQMKFVSLRNEKAVANTCWGFHGTERELYCDIPGEGYVSFQIKAGSCALDLFNIYYYDGDGNKIQATQEQFNQLQKILIDSGGNDGNPYKGIGTIVLPDDPNPAWS